MEQYLGTIKLFAGNFAPRGWAFCHGQLLSISQNTALFSLLGITYGGNGSTTFGLPDLRGRVPMGAEKGANISVALGQRLGSETSTLTSANATAGAGGATVAVASDQPHLNEQPYLGLNFIICLQGLYPPRHY
jgi:microcystin-dependent protein